MIQLEIYTDGASGQHGHGPSGWAYLIRGQGHEIAVHGSLPESTAPRAELTAVLKALSALTNGPYRIRFYTDSRYVADAFRKYWVRDWEARDFLNVKNTDLWSQVIPLVQAHHISWFLVPAHSGNKYNEIVDCLAVKAKHWQLPEQVASWIETEVVDE